MKNQQLKGQFGSISIVKSKETYFTFLTKIIDKRPKLKKELETTIKSLKENQSHKQVGFLEIRNIIATSVNLTIVTEPILNCLPNFLNFKFKINQIFEMFKNFNTFLKNCNESGINLSELKLSDIYITEKYDLKILSKYYYFDILRNIKQQKLNEEENIPHKNIKNPKNNTKKSDIFFIIGKILYYLYYNRYPQKNEHEYPKCETFSDLIKKCLKININHRISYEEYFNHPFFHPKIVFPYADKEKITPFSLYRSYSEKEINIQKYEGINYESKMNDSYYYITNILDQQNNILLHIEDKREAEFYKLKNSKNKNLYVFPGLYTIYIIKKNSEKSFSLIQTINTSNNEQKEYYYLPLELSSGDIAFITWNDKKKKNYVSIFSKLPENQFQKYLVINGIKEPTNIYETDDNIMIITSKEISIFYDVKKGLKKIKNENKNNEYMYINSKFYFKYKNFSLSIYNNEYDEEIFKIKKYVLCIKRLQDGTYLLGESDNYIYQIFFDKYGTPGIICIVDSCYGTYEDDDYTFSKKKAYGVGRIDQFENGDIITYSDYLAKVRLWKLNK